MAFSVFMCEKNKSSRGVSHSMVLVRMGGFLCVLLVLCDEEQEASKDHYLRNLVVLLVALPPRILGM